MAPIDPLYFNYTGMPTTDIPPPSGPPPDAISWRAMITNWFGSMFFIGLCAPLMVWMIVYCIRLRSSRKKKKKKTWKLKRGATPTPTGLTITLDDGMERERLGGPFEIETYDPIPLNPVSAPVRNKAGEKISMGEHFRNYLGWRSTSPPHENPSSSSDVISSRDRRVREERLRKRDHFVKYLGWWSSHETEAPISRPCPTCNKLHPSTGQRSLRSFPESVKLGPASLTVRRPMSTPHSHDEGTGPVISLHQIISKEAKETTSANSALATEMSTDGENLSHIGPTYLSRLRSWRIGRHRRAHASTENLAERGQLKKSQTQLTITSIEEEESGLSTPPRANTTGVDVRVSDGSVEFVPQAKGQADDMMIGGLGSDETSGHKTVRRRTVGKAEAYDWANLSHEINRSVHTQILLPDDQNDGASAPESFQDTDITLFGTLSPVKDPIHATELWRNKVLSPVPPPRLRKVCSSPTLHQAFMQLHNSLTRAPFHTIKPPIISLSNPTQLVPCHDQVDDFSSEGSLDPFKTLYMANAAHSNGMTTLIRTENVSKSSQAFSFDRRRRSTLDVVRLPTEADRRTLDDYEAEGSVDGETANRDRSNTTMSSYERPPSCEANMHIGHSGYIGVRFPIHESNGRSLDDIGAIFGLDSNTEIHPTITNMTSFGGGRNLTDDFTRSLNQMDLIDGRFATLVVPKRRYSFPSLEKRKGVKSEVNRKFIFRFSDLEHKNIIDASNMRPRSLPRHISRVPYTGRNGASDLLVSRKRAPRSTGVGGLEKKTTRKLTPFVDWSNVSTPNPSPRKSLSGDCQPLDRLSEAVSCRSENASPLHSRSKASYHFHAIKSSDCSTTQDFVTCPTSPVHPNMLANSRSRFAKLIGFSSPTDASKMASPTVSTVPTASASLITSPSSVRMSEKMSFEALVLIDTQPSIGRESIKQAFRGPSSAEKVKRRETMRRAGRLRKSEKVKKVTVNIDVESKNGSSGCVDAASGLS